MSFFLEHKASMTLLLRVGATASRRMPFAARAVLLLSLGAPSAHGMQNTPDTLCVSDRGAVSGNGFSLTPTLSLTDATTKIQTYGGDAHLLVGHYPPTKCGPAHSRFDVLLNGKYDQKRRLDAAPSITRHYTGRVQELVMLPRPPYHTSVTAQFLSDNSLALYLQQTYTLAVGRTFGTDALIAEVNLGGAFAAQHFTTKNPTTDFAAPAASALLDWTIPVLSSDGKSRPSPEVQVMAAGVFGLGDNPRILTGNAAISIPTFFPPLSFTIKSWMDYISNPPTGFLNHWFTLEFGPQFKLGMFAQ